MARELPRLSTDRLVIRFLDDEDAPEVLDFYTRNRAFFEQTNPARPASSYSLEYWRAQIPKNRVEFLEDRACPLFVFFKEDPKRVIGQVNLFAFIRGTFHACILGYSLDEKHTGRGLMTEAVRRVVEYGFEELRLHRIMANYWPENVRSGLLLARLGFQRDGYARDYLQIQDRWVDHYMTAKINTSWKAP
jgi:ribosomal-protein-alanine N-acetyltransferase